MVRAPKLDHKHVQCWLRQKFNEIDMFCAHRPTADPPLLFYVSYIFSGHPHLDECKSFGQRVMPHLVTCSLPEVYGRIPKKKLRGARRLSG